MALDEKNCAILNLLQDNCRISLTDISKKIGISVDSVKRRIDKMIEENIFYPRIQMRPRHFGFPYIIEAKIKLNFEDSKKNAEFIKYLINHPRVAEILAFAGDWDYKIVIISQGHEELDEITNDIRKKFSGVIRDWSEALTTVVYKFEKYDMSQLLNPDL